MGLEIGTVCYKLTGRRAGKKVVIVGFDKETKLPIIEGEAKAARRCNPLHLWPTTETVRVMKKIDSVAKPVVEHKKRQEKKKTKSHKEKVVKKSEAKKPVAKKEAKEKKKDKKSVKK